MKLLLSVLLLFSCCIVQAQSSDSMKVKLNKTTFHREDTLTFDCSFTAFAKDSILAATIQVWIEYIETNQIWKFRYPMLNGLSSGALFIKNTIPAGNYAVNFLLQKEFLAINGQIRDYKIRDKSIDFFMLSKNQAEYMDELNPSVYGSFHLPNLLFQDTAFFVFSYHKNNEWRDLYINLQTPLDSVFTPINTVTQLITIGKSIIPIDSIHYQFDYLNAYRAATLPEVTVKAKEKKKVELFDEEYSTGNFRNGFAKVFDGIESDQIARYPSVTEFLRAHGLLYGTLNYFNTSNYAVAYFLDEIELPSPDIYYINTADVAMIKIYAAPSNIPTFRNSGNGSVIAIYTKKGKYDNNPNRKYKFKIAGYTAPESVWK